MIESGIVAVGTFLVSHPDLVLAIESAITNGVSKASIIELIRKAQVDAADAAMKQELNLP
jgi:hypothetical protein